MTENDHAIRHLQRQVSDLIDLVQDIIQDLPDDQESKDRLIRRSYRIGEKPSQEAEQP
jgi:hypothetical protein